MQKIELSPEEAEVLREMLQHYDNELDIEVFRTDSPAFKERLKHRRVITEDLLAKLGPAPVGSA